MSKKNVLTPLPTFCHKFFSNQLPTSKPIPLHIHTKSFHQADPSLPPPPPHTITRWQITLGLFLPTWHLEKKYYSQTIGVIITWKPYDTNTSKKVERGSPSLELLFNVNISVGLSLTNTEVVVPPIHFDKDSKTSFYP